VPQECFGTDWTATVELDSTWTDVVINGDTVVNGDTVTFDSIAGGRYYTVSAVIDSCDTISGQLTFTWLPVLELAGDFGYEYTEGTVTLNMPDGSKGNDWRAKLKWRGGITNGTNKHKRNYHIKFLDENGDKKNRRLLGLRKDNHWKLDAGQMDELRVRNRVGCDLWLDLARKPWYANDSLDVVNGSRGAMTEVVLNGEYRGIYNLCEPVDRKQLQLEKYDTVANVFKGGQWVSKQWTRTVTMSNPATCSNNQSTWDGFEVNYPDFDDVSPTDWSPLYNSVWFIKNCDRYDRWDDYVDSLGTYFDLPVMMDYFIFIISLQALDNESKNIYYSCYDRNVDSRLTMTAWDLDMSTGADIAITGDYSSYIYPERPVNWISQLAMVALPGHGGKIYHQIVKRYWELREGCLNTDSLVNRYQSAIDELEACGAAAREEARWSGDSDLGGKKLDLSVEMAYVADWLKRRMAYLDENVFVNTTIVGDVNDDGEVTIADVNAIVDFILSGTYYAAADVNGDGEVTIADVNAVISIILGSDV